MRAASTVAIALLVLFQTPPSQALEPANPRTNSQARGILNYPGDTYVDIVGLDAYTDFVDPQHTTGYDELAKLPKPFGFTEFGPHGPQNPPGDYDYLRFLDGVRKKFPKTSFFLAWN